MRLAVVAEWLRPEGGVTRSLIQFLQALDPNEVEVTLLLLRDDGGIRELVPGHVRVFENLAVFAYSGALSACREALRTHGLRECLRLAWLSIMSRATKNNIERLTYMSQQLVRIQGRFDVVASYAMLDAFSNYVAAHCVDADRRVMWCHTDATLYSKREVELLSTVYERFDRINCVGENTRNALAKIHPQLRARMSVFHNLVDIDKISHLSHEPTSLPPHQGTLLCTVARISHEKGIDLAVKAAARLAEKGTAFTWWIVGPEFDESYSSDIRDLIASHGLKDIVVLLGPAKNPFPYMRACDIYIQPSRVEGFCGSTIEAKILARPVVRTAIPDAFEQFDHGINGSIVAFDADALAEELDHLIMSPETRARYSRALTQDQTSQVPRALSAFEIDRR